MKKFTLLFLAVALCFSALADNAYRLAIAEPVNKGPLAAEEVSALWGMLESSFPTDQKEYQLVSRAALKQMLEEIGLTENSGLTELNSEQKAKMGKLKTVNYILISEIGKFGTQYNLTMRIIDSSTGEIDMTRTINLRAKSLDDIADKLEPTIEKMLSDQKDLRRVALLHPVNNLPISVPNVAETFNVYLENYLLESKIPMQNLKSVSKILTENNLGALSELEPKLYKKVGSLLEVQLLIQATINSLEVLSFRQESPETGYVGYEYIAKYAGTIAAINPKTGEIVKNAPVEVSMNLGKTRGNVPAMQLTDDLTRTILKEAARKSAQQILSIGNSEN